jgi:hypothetical protein
VALILQNYSTALSDLSSLNIFSSAHWLHGEVHKL